MLGDVIIDFLWGGKKFDKSDVNLAYIFLIFNITGILLSSLGSVYRKMAVAHGKGKQLYFYWVFSQILSAGFSYFLIRYFKINGLFFIIPINAFLMGSVSYYIYKKTEASISYKFLNINNFIALVLISLSIIIKYKSIAIYNLDNKYFILIALILSTMVLSLYPLINTYRLFRLKKSK